MLHHITPLKTIELTTDLCKRNLPHCHMESQFQSSVSWSKRKYRNQHLRRQDQWKEATFSETDKHMQRQNEKYFNEDVRETSEVKGTPSYLQKNPQAKDFQSDDVVFLSETPFQLGGLAHPVPIGKHFGWPEEASLSGRGFSGCIKNVRINNQVRYIIFQIGIIDEELNGH